MNKKRFLMLGVALCTLLAGTRAQQAEKFSIATLNVDGLPQKILMFNVNADGPGSSGTVRIGKYLIRKNYDMVVMQEDYDFHEELSVMLEDDYDLDTWSGTVGIDIPGKSIDFLHLQNERFECDGLMAAWKKGIEVTNAERTAWTDGFGKFSHSNDLLATKGFRRYEVTLESGTQIVVYTMHMDAELEADTEEGKAGPDRAARIKQWEQLRDHILLNLDDRPVIALGGSNSFYFRDKVEQEFISAVNLSGKASASDVWVELENGGQYPAYEEDNRSRDDAVEEHGGETLDKVIYINPEGSYMQLKPVAYSLDQEGYQYDGKPLGDHYPVAVTFEIIDNRKPATGIASHEAPANGNTVYYNMSGQHVSKPQGGLYIEQDSKGTRKCIIK